MGSPQLPSPTDGSFLHRAAHQVESLARLSAFVLLLTYASGFVIVNIHHGQFGIAELSLLKVRVLAAGVLFVLLTVLPAVTAARIFGMFGLGSSLGVELKYKPADRGWQRVAVTAGMYMACFALASVTTPLFEDGPWRSGLLVFTVPSILVVLVPLLGHYFSEHPKKCTLFIVICTVGLGWTALAGYGLHLFVRSLWFYGCALATVWARYSISSPEYIRRVEFERFIGLPIAAVIIFSLGLYGNVKPRFGGGAPVPVQLYLIADAVKIFGADSVQAWLIDQTEFGFYILRSRHDTKSTLVPRTLIRAIDFTNSEVLTGTPAKK